MPRFADFTTLVSLKKEVPREHVLDNWHGPYAQQKARYKDIEEYRQYHFVMDSQGIWPELAGVETKIPFEHRIDGVEEELIKTSAVKRKRHIKSAEEAKAFKKTERYMTYTGDRQFYESSIGNKNAGFRAVIFIRRNSASDSAEFKHFIKKVFLPALAASSSFSEIRCKCFRQADFKRSGEGPKSLLSYDAVFVLAAADYHTFIQALSSSNVTAIQKAQGRFCEAIHAYAVANMYIFKKEGRPTLPQIKPERKLRLEPVQRKLPPAPKRAFQNEGTVPFPPAHRLSISGYGPEDVVADSEGRLLCGVKGGRILRIDPEKNTEETIGDTKGRPLGLELLADGHLLICDAHKGLLRLNTETGDMEILVQYVNNTPLRFCSNATAASDGTIWFTESSNRFDFEQYTGAMLEHRPSGRLFRRDPDGRVEVVLEGLYFANGITLSSDEKAVIFSETDAYRLNRLWVRGPYAGKREILVDNLPGFPDNISRIQDGKFWTAIVAPRNPLLDRLGTMPAFVRKLIWRIPDRWRPKGAETAWAILFDEQGNILLDLQNSAIDYRGVTGVAESNGQLYFAGLEEDALLSIELVPKG